MAGAPDPIEIEWQFDALDLRPVERWLAALPTLSIDGDEQLTITALAKPPRRLVDSYLDTEDWRMLRAGFVVRTRRRGRQDEITLKDNSVRRGVRWIAPAVGSDRGAPTGRRPGPRT